MGAGGQRGSRAPHPHAPFSVHPHSPRSVGPELILPCPAPRPGHGAPPEALLPLAARRRQSPLPERPGLTRHVRVPRAQRINPRARTAEMSARARALPLPPAETRWGANGCPVRRAQPARMPSAASSLALARVAGSAPLLPERGLAGAHAQWCCHVGPLRADGARRVSGAAGLVRPRAPDGSSVPPGSAAAFRGAESFRGAPLLLHA